MIKDAFRGESGFVAHTLNGNLTSAVSSVTIEATPLGKDRLAKAIGWADRAVVDANLSRRQICEIAKLCKKRKIPLFACGVSESKVKRLVDLPREESPLFCLVFMNRKEAAAAGFSLDELRRSAGVRTDMLTRFSSLHAVITDSTSGYWLFTNDGSGAPEGVAAFPSVSSNRVVSTLGAGDALFASIVAMAPNLDWQKHVELAESFVRPVLSSNTAVPGLPEQKISLGWEELLTSSWVFAGCLTLTTILFWIGFFGPVQSTARLSAIFLAMAITGGISGALLAGRLNLKTYQSGKHDASLGATAGLLSALLLAMPYLLTGLDDEKLEAILLKKLMVSGLLISVVGGMTGQRYLKGLVRTIRLPDNLPAAVNDRVPQ